jgi:hypothetical protein
VTDLKEQLKRTKRDFQDQIEGLKLDMQNNQIHQRSGLLQ